MGYPVGSKKRGANQLQAEAANTAWKKLGSQVQDQVAWSHRAVTFRMKTMGFSCKRGTVFEPRPHGRREGSVKRAASIQA